MEKNMMVNLGRVVMVNYGPLSGKLAVIIDLVNASKVVIEGPGLGVPRVVISNKRLTLTKFSLPDVAPGISTKDLAVKVSAFKVTDRFRETGLGKKIAKQERRAKLTDFERFKAFTLKKQLGKAVRTQVNKSRKTIAKAAKSDKPAEKKTK